jgi:hypothetical protein
MTMRRRLLCRALGFTFGVIATILLLCSLLPASNESHFGPPRDGLIFRVLEKLEDALHWLGMPQRIRDG